MQDTLARKLRVLRAERGLTLREAEQLTSVDKDTLSKIERGLRHPYDVTLSKLARGYGVPVEDLLEEPVPLAKAPEEAGLTEAERLHELRSFAVFFNRFAKRWSEETQECLAAGQGPFNWGLEKQCAALWLVQSAIEVPSIGGRDDIEFGLSREEQRAKLELSQAVDELFRVANKAYEAQRALDKDDAAGIPESMLATQKRHLAALKNIA